MSEQIRCVNCKHLHAHDSACPFCGWDGTTLPQDAVCLVPGTVLKDRYELGRVLGNGGFGVTYLAWDKLFDRKVAVKEYMPLDLSTRGKGETDVTVFSGKKGEYFQKGKSKFIEEAQLLAKFENDPAIVNVLDYFEDHATAYNVMEFIDGKTISAILREHGKYSAKETVNCLLPIVESLKNLHKHGLIHRDIAPDNIMITKDGRAKLIDFGSARYAAFNSQEKSLTVMVKQGYSAPEQYMSKGERGTFTDVYSIGATMYKMLTGITPPESLERKTEIMEGEGDSLEPIKKYAPESVWLEPLILDAMNVFAKKRIQDMETLSERLRAVGPDQTTEIITGRQEVGAETSTDRSDQSALNQKTLLIDGSNDDDRTVAVAVETDQPRSSDAIYRAAQSAANQNTLLIDEEAEVDRPVDAAAKTPEPRGSDSVLPKDDSRTVYDAFDVFKSMIGNIKEKESDSDQVRSKSTRRIDWVKWD